MIDTIDHTWNDDRQWCVSPCLEAWSPPVMQLTGDRPETDVVFNPVAQLVFNERSREQLGVACGRSVEWLPIHIKDEHNYYYIMHPMEFISLSKKAEFYTNSISRNITQVNKMVLNDPHSDAGAFLIRQKIGSVAEAGGFGLMDLIISQKADDAVSTKNITGLRIDEVLVEKTS